MSAKVITTCLKCSLLGVFLLFLQPLRAQTAYPELEQQLQAEQKTLGTDVVVMVWKDDTLAYKKEMGNFLSKTQASLGGCSKWLTAALLMSFVEEGKLSLDDKVAKWLPEFERYNKNYITIRHCLAHLTGIEDEGKKIFQRKKFASLEEEVNAVAARPIRTNAGQDFWYGNAGLNIAARVLEVISRKKFDLLMKQRLLNPLEMRRTTFTTTDGSAINPSTGALSTPDDFMHFLAMLLNKGKYKDKQVLSAESIDRLLQVQTTPALISYSPAAAAGLNYALGGWAVKEKDGKAMVLASPDFAGTWPWVDFCRGYALLIFTKQPLDHEKAGLYQDLKRTLDQQVPASCP